VVVTPSASAGSLSLSALADPNPHCSIFLSNPGQQGAIPPALPPRHHPNPNDAFARAVSTAGFPHHEGYGFRPESAPPTPRNDEPLPVREQEKENAKVATGVLNALIPDQNGLGWPGT
jgi:hypothetical protein